MGKFFKEAGIGSLLRRGIGMAQKAKPYKYTGRIRTISGEAAAKSRYIRDTEKALAYNKANPTGLKKGLSKVKDIINPARVNARNVATQAKAKFKSDTIAVSRILDKAHIPRDAHKELTLIRPKRVY